MESYADIGFYRNAHKGKFNGTCGELRRLLERASLKVDSLTRGRIQSRGFAALTVFQREMVRYAVCFQADYYAQNGLEGEAALKGYSAAGVSVTFAGADKAAREKFSSVGYELLEQTGLLWQGV